MGRHGATKDRPVGRGPDDEVHFLSSAALSVTHGL